MRLLKRFGYIFYQSLTSAAFYRQIIKKPPSWSVKFYFLYSLLAALLIAIVFHVRYVPTLNRLAEIVPGELAQILPADVVITITSGQASINQPEPYLIPLTRLYYLIQTVKDQVLGLDTTDITNLMVIDTSAQIEDIHRLRTLSLLTQNYLVYQSESGKLEVYSLSQIPDTQISQDNLINLAVQISPLLKRFIPYITLVVFLSLVTFVPLFWLGVMVLGAGIVYVISRVFKSPASFSQTYQMNLHVFILASSLNILAICVKLPTIPSSFLLLVTGLISLILHTNLGEVRPVPKPSPSKSA